LPAALSVNHPKNGIFFGSLKFLPNTSILSGASCIMGYLSNKTSFTEVSSVTLYALDALIPERIFLTLSRNVLGLSKFGSLLPTTSIWIAPTEISLTG